MKTILRMLVIVVFIATLFLGASSVSVSAGSPYPWPWPGNSQIWVDGNRWTGPMASWVEVGQPVRLMAANYWGVDWGYDKVVHVKWEIKHLGATVVRETEKEILAYTWDSPGLYEVWATKTNQKGESRSLMTPVGVFRMTQVSGPDLVAETGEASYTFDVTKITGNPNAILGAVYDQGLLSSEADALACIDIHCSSFGQGSSMNLTDGFQGWTLSTGPTTSYIKVSSSAGTVTLKNLTIILFWREKAPYDDGSSGGSSGSVDPLIEKGPAWVSLKVGVNGLRVRISNCGQPEQTTGGIGEVLWRFETGWGNGTHQFQIWNGTDWVAWSEVVFHGSDLIPNRTIKFELPFP